jgi:pimeloyl-ACP methyl ester carboxylesterase
VPDSQTATASMQDLGIDKYLAAIDSVVDHLGGKVHLVGLCQGGWMGAMYAARFSHKVGCIVLAGAPIDTDAGDGPIRQLAHSLPLSLYE